MKPVNMLINELRIEHNELYAKISANKFAIATLPFET